MNRFCSYRFAVAVIRAHTLVEAIDDLDRQFPIRWVWDVLLMHGRVDMSHIFQRRLSM